MLPETDATGSEMDAAPTVPADGDLAAELSGLPGVTKVCRRTTFSEDQYLLYYEMPIDHSVSFTRSGAPVRKNCFTVPGGIFIVL